MIGDELPFSSLDLDRYLARILFSGQLRTTAETLRSLHLAHALNIPFENLDILLGKPISLGLPAIQAKLVDARRGGYCFEQNLLFAAVLQRIGFTIQFLAARVRYRVHRILPRTHVLLLVDVEGAPWIADVGFGTVGLLEPMPLAVGIVVEQSGWRYRLFDEEGCWVLQTRQGEEWQSLYAFTLEPQHLPDLEMANHYVSTHPDSRFVQMLIVQRSTREARHLLRNLDSIIDRGGESVTTSIRGETELLQVLAEQFGLILPKGARFRIPSLVLHSQRGG